MNSRAWSGILREQNRNKGDKSVPGPNGNDYKYDVFLSYRSREKYNVWIQENFKQLFIDTLAEEIDGEEPRVFFDKDVLQPGDIWEDELKKAISHARCLVALCSPTYFRSKYCRLEWFSFQARGADPRAGGKSSIIPVVLHYGPPVPTYVPKIQYGNFAAYVRIGDAFRKQDAFFAFQEDLEKLAGAVAKQLKLAPKFHPDWPIDYGPPAAPAGDEASESTPSDGGARDGAAPAATPAPEAQGCAGPEVIAAPRITRVVMSGAPQAAAAGASS